MTILTQGGFQGLARNASADQIVDKLNRLMIGRMNATQDFTLNSGSFSTSALVDHRIGPGSFIAAMPLTSNAALTLANTGSPFYVSTQTQGSATIQHLSATQTDRKFRFVIIG